MRTLYMCRHAKSSWSHPGLSDHDRPLNDRGIRDAPFMARVFMDRMEAPDLLMSSTAERAAATARTFARILGAVEATTFDHSTAGPVLMFDQAMYHASVDGLLRIINALPDHARRVMLFGHNPGATEIVNVLSSADIGNIPTCGMVRIDFPFNSWSMVSRDTGTAIWQDFPKHHPIPG